MAEWERNATEMDTVAGFKRLAAKWDWVDEEAYAEELAACIREGYRESVEAAGEERRKNGP